MRFKIGDRIQANLGTWKPGKIIGIWDEGNPYRIELEDGEKTNIGDLRTANRFVKRQ